MLKKKAFIPLFGLDKYFFTANIIQGCIIIIVKDSATIIKKN